MWDIDRYIYLMATEQASFYIELTRFLCSIRTAPYVQTPQTYAIRVEAYPSFASKRHKLTAMNIQKLLVAVAKVRGRDKLGLTVEPCG
jgi:hypothetical protein